MKAEQILLQMMQSYAQASAKWVSQQNELDQSFLKGEFQSWLKHEIASQKEPDNDTE